MFSQSKLRRRTSISKKRKQRSGIATVEFALCLPLLALICFGSIQASSTILLRHKSTSTLEIGTLDFMLGNVTQDELATHIEDLSKDFEIVNAKSEVTEVVINDLNFLRVELHVPVPENTTSLNFITNPLDLSTQVLVFRP